MADDLHYVPGDNYILDDLSGFKIRASKARMIPGGQTGGLYVAPERWEDQQPQDFVTGVADDQTVAISRSRQRNQFVVTGTYVTAASAVRSTTITVADTAGFNASDAVLLMLDSGINWYVGIASISGNTITLNAPLPSSVGALYGDPLENSLLRVGP